MSRIFEQIGIFGMPEEHEDVLLACLLTGDPALLIGKQGTAKTGLVGALSAAMCESRKRKFPKDPDKWIRHHAYDSSKINFEDLIGLPNVEKLKEGKMEFVQSPLTAWDKDIVSFDEFNRQAPEQQNNIFELIRSRKIQGMDTKVKWIINCMNPFGMAGTDELDEALVDRHAWFLYVNSFDSLPDKAKTSIATHVGQHDAPALKNFWNGQQGDFDVDEEGAINNKLADVGDSIFEIMENAAVFYKDLRNNVSTPYGVFISRFQGALTAMSKGKDWSVEISGRRVGMLHRNALSLRAVELAKAQKFPRYKVRTLKDSCKIAVEYGIPAGISKASGQGMNKEAVGAINAAVDQLGEFFKRSGEISMIAAVDTIYELLTTTSLARKMDILMNEVTDETTKSQTWSDILSPPKDLGKFEKTRRDILVNISAHLITVKPDAVPQNFHKNLVRAAKETGGMKSLFSPIILKGEAAFYAEDIREHLTSIESPFVRLQARISYEDALSDKAEFCNKREFSRIQNDVIGECRSLTSLLENRGIKDFDDPAKSVKGQADKLVATTEEVV